jgi:hypothetical protein
MMNDEAAGSFRILPVAVKRVTPVAKGTLKLNLKGEDK